MADPVYLTINEFPGTGAPAPTVVDFSFAGGYISPAHVKAELFDPATYLRTPVTVTDDNFVTAFRLSLPVIVPAGHVLRVYRDTPKDQPLVDFTNGARIAESNLDLVAQQAVFVAAEAADQIAITQVADVLQAVEAAAVNAELSQASAEDSANSAAASELSASAGASAAAAAAEDAIGAAATAVAMVASDDGAGGSLFTTVQGFITRLMSSMGSALVGFIQSGTGAVLETLQKILRQRVTVTQFGATGDGVTSDTAAFIAAYTAHPGKTIHMPEPAVGYKLDGLLTIPANTVFKGDRRHGTKLLHAYNGDFANLSDGAGFEDCWIDGQGSTYTGGCFVMSGTNGRQVRKGVRASDFDGPVESFDATAGSQSIAMDIRYSRRNAGTGTNRYAVVISPTQQISAVPRKFFGIETDGACAFDFGGCNNVQVVGGFVADLKYTPESRAVALVGLRVANQLALTIDGHNNSASACDFSPQLTFASGTDANSFQGCTYNNLPIINNSGNGRNLMDHWRISYTPTLTSGGTQPALGNGVLAASFSCAGSVVFVDIELTVGSTTTLGTGDLRFSIPTEQPNSNPIVQYPGVAVLSRGGTSYTANVQMPSATNWVRMIRDTSGSVAFNSPATWAAGDIFRLSFAYQK